MQNTVPETATKLLALSLDIKTEGAPGTFEGYGAIFGNKDRDGDIVTHGAFAESLKAGMPVLLWQHDQKAPIGRFDEVREDEKGLFVKGRLALHGRGLEAYELLKMGALDGLSIGFVTKEASRDPATSTRTISKADLMEISLVTFPANELARVSTVKAAGFDEKDTDMPETDMAETDMLDADVNTARSFERMLRENGFSRSRAKTITAKGFKATDFAADETAEIAKIVTELKERRYVIEQKYSKTYPVHEGDTLNEGLFYSIEKEFMAISIIPRDKNVTFKARVNYEFWSEDGPTARTARFSGKNGRGAFSQSVRVRERDAGWVERILGGKRGALVKKMKLQIKTLEGSTSYKVSVG